MRKGALTGIVLLVLAALMVAGFLYVLNSNRPLALDPETRCPDLAERQGLTLILVDSTSAFGPDAARALRANIKMALAELPGRAEIRIAALSGGANARGRQSAGPPAQSRLLWLLNRCAPERADEANPLFRNRDKLAVDWVSGFENPVLRALGRARSRAESRDSQIIEALRMAAAQTGLLRRTGPKRVILASDLIERNGEWGLDQAEMRWPEPAAIAARFHADADGDAGEGVAQNAWAEVEITALMLPAPGTAVPGRPARREEWWRAFFAALGADARIVPL